MLSPAFATTGSQLSASAQATLNKHLSKHISSKRFIQSSFLNDSAKRNLTTQTKVAPLVQTAEVGCLTDICTHENLPEVEIFSLLEEQLPKYKLRADFLTDFSGYANNDWFIKAPALDIPKKGLGLTKEQTRQTLHYFLLCGNRVSQMSRAYNDIEAVTRLLEEKEKDLELTVQIGKELLMQNNQLESRISELETELKSAKEDQTQLVHELHKKNELISVLTNDAEEASDNETPTFSKSITFDLLQKKITHLQDENRTLKMEATQLVSETDAVEAHERQLMSDLTSQLNEANSQYDNLSLELERLREENHLQHEQIVHLTARLSDTELRLHQITTDNNEHLTLLNITKENQNSLAIELVEFKQRYQEVLSLLQEAQNHLRRQRKKSMPQVCSLYMGVGANSLQPDSLQSELMELSIYSENSLDSGISGDNVLRLNSFAQKKQQQLPPMHLAGNAFLGNHIEDGFPSKTNYKNIFDTVRCISKTGYFIDNGDDKQNQHRDSATTFCSNISEPRLSTTTQNNNNIGQGDKTMTYENESDSTYAQPPVGVPGTPGAKELEAALKRLTPAEVLARRAMLSYAPVGTYSYEETMQQPTLKSIGVEKLSGLQPMGIRTPESIMSTGGSSSGVLSAASNFSSSTSLTPWRLPQKLQIIKPVEGSQTLHQWSCLATPTLGGLLEDRPGVTIRGGRGLEELGMQYYTLSDVEEDVSDLPGKQFDSSGCTYTYTNSMVMHPDDGVINDSSFLSQSQMSSRIASTSTSRHPSCPPTPRRGTLSRKNSCSTFSVNLGLASMLNERGIKAVSPSALNTPIGSNYSPTVTPCNSPEGSSSPNRSISPEPLFGGLLSSGAYLLRRKLIGSDLERPSNLHQQQQKLMVTRLERRALRSLRLVEKVESIGLENIIKTPPSAMSQMANGIVNRSASPMAQLTSLKNMQHHQQQLRTAKNVSNQAIMDFDRDQIVQSLKGVSSFAMEEQQKSDTASSLMEEDSVTSAGAVITTSKGNVLDDKTCLWNMGSEGAQKTCNNRPLFKIGAMINIEQNSSSGSDEDIMSSKYRHNNIEGVSISSTAPITNTRVNQMRRQRSRRFLKNGQRQDLGTIDGRIRADLGQVAGNSSIPKRDKNNSQQDHQQHALGDSSKASTAELEELGRYTGLQSGQREQPTFTQSFVGTVSSLLFGRKGGWL